MRLRIDPDRLAVAADCVFAIFKKPMYSTVPVCTYQPVVVLTDSTCVSVRYDDMSY